MGGAILQTVFPSGIFRFKYIGDHESASFTGQNFKHKNRVTTNVGTTMANKRNKIRNKALL